MEFPKELPSDQIALFAGLIVRGELKTKRREAAYAAWLTQGYVMSVLIKNPTPAAGTLAIAVQMDDTEAADTLAALIGDQQATIDRAKLLRLLTYLVQILPLLIG